MRVIAGSLKGRRIPFRAKRSGQARVTSDFVKGAAFSILGEGLSGQWFLDVFAGSGQIGLEAHSRGAHVVMNEADRQRHRGLSELLEAWGLEGDIALHCRKAARLLPELAGRDARFSVAYLDPPYDRPERGDTLCATTLEQLCSSPLMGPGGVVLVQHASPSELPDHPGSMALVRQRAYGNTSLSLYRAQDQP